jgi:hypothetical protein
MGLKNPILVWFELPGHRMTKGQIYWYRQKYFLKYIHGILEDDEYPEDPNEVYACEDFLIYKRKE